MKTAFRHFFHHAVGVISLLAFLVAGCAHDPYQQRADIMKTHVENFYTHLKANRVGAAVHENEEIELMADQMAETVKKQSQLLGTSHVEREFALMKTARATAAQNWIALGQYFAIKQQPERARSSYQRVIDTYTDSTERTYREHADRALKDLDIISGVPPDSTH